MLWISGWGRPIVSYWWVNTVEGVPAESTCRSYVCSRGRSASSSQWPWQPWRRARTGGGWSRDYRQSSCMIIQLQAEVRKLLERYWAVCSGRGSRLQVETDIHNKGAQERRLLCLSLPIPLKGGERGSHLCVQSPRPGLPFRVESCWRRWLTQQQRASSATCIINLVHFK